jgi:GTPase SAR1 family protein
LCLWQGILLVFDVSSRSSFEYLRTTLLVEVNQYAPSTCKRVLVASKCDLDLKQHGDEGAPECGSRAVSQGGGELVLRLAAAVTRPLYYGDMRSRAVSHEEALQFAHENDMDYFETSAKDGIGIRESLFALTRQVLAPAPAALDGGQLA